MPFRITMASLEVGGKATALREMLERGVEDKAVFYTLLREYLEDIGLGEVLDELERDEHLQGYEYKKDFYFPSFRRISFLLDVIVTAIYLNSPYPPPHLSIKETIAKAVSKVKGKRSFIGVGKKLPLSLKLGATRHLSTIPLFLLYGISEVLDGQGLKKTQSLAKEPNNFAKWGHVFYKVIGKIPKELKSKNSVPWEVIDRIEKILLYGIPASSDNHSNNRCPKFSPRFFPTPNLSWDNIKEEYYFFGYSWKELSPSNLLGIFRVVKELGYVSWIEWQRLLDIMEREEAWEEVWKRIWSHFEGKGSLAPLFTGGEGEGELLRILERLGEEGRRHLVDMFSKVTPYFVRSKTFYPSSIITFLSLIEKSQMKEGFPYLLALLRFPHEKAVTLQLLRTLVSIHGVIGDSERKMVEEYFREVPFWGRITTPSIYLLPGKGRENERELFLEFVAKYIRGGDYVVAWILDRESFVNGGGSEEEVQRMLREVADEEESNLLSRMETLVELLPPSNTASPRLWKVLKDISFRLLDASKNLSSPRSASLGVRLFRNLYEVYSQEALELLPSLYEVIMGLGHEDKEKLLPEIYHLFSIAHSHSPELSNSFLSLLMETPLGYLLLASSDPFLFVKQGGSWGAAKRYSSILKGEGKINSLLAMYHMLAANGKVPNSHITHIVFHYLGFPPPYLPSSIFPLSKEDLSLLRDLDNPVFTTFADMLEGNIAEIPIQEKWEVAGLLTSLWEDFSSKEKHVLVLRIMKDFFTFPTLFGHAASFLSKELSLHYLAELEYFSMSIEERKEIGEALVEALRGDKSRLISFLSRLPFDQLLRLIRSAEREEYEYLLSSLKQKYTNLSKQEKVRVFNELFSILHDLATSPSDKFKEYDELREFLGELGEEGKRLSSIVKPSNEFRNQNEKEEDYVDLIAKKMAVTVSTLIWLHLADKHADSLALPLPPEEKKLGAFLSEVLTGIWEKYIMPNAAFETYWLSLPFLLNIQARFRITPLFPHVIEYLRKKSPSTWEMGDILIYLVDVYPFLSRQERLEALKALDLMERGGFPSKLLEQSLDLLDKISTISGVDDPLPPSQVFEMIKYLDEIAHEDPERFGSVEELVEALADHTVETYLEANRGWNESWKPFWKSLNERRGIFNIVAKLVDTPTEYLLESSDSFREDAEHLLKRRGGKELLERLLYHLFTTFYLPSFSHSKNKNSMEPSFFYLIGRYHLTSLLPHLIEVALHPSLLYYEEKEALAMRWTLDTMESIYPYLTTKEKLDVLTTLAKIITKRDPVSSFAALGSALYLELTHSNSEDVPHPALITMGKSGLLPQSFQEEWYAYKGTFGDLLSSLSNKRRKEILAPLEGFITFLHINTILNHELWENDLVYPYFRALAVVEAMEKMVEFVKKNRLRELYPSVLRLLNAAARNKKCDFLNKRAAQLLKKTEKLFSLPKEKKKAHGKAPSHSLRQ